MSNLKIANEDIPVSHCGDPHCACYGPDPLLLAAQGIGRREPVPDADEDCGGFPWWVACFASGLLFGAVVGVAIGAWL